MSSHIRQRRSLGAMRMGKRHDYTSSSDSYIDNVAVNSHRHINTNLGEAVERLITALDENRERQSRVLQNKIFYNLYKNEGSRNENIKSTTTRRPLSAAHTHLTDDNISLSQKQEIFQMLKDIRNRKYSMYGSLWFVTFWLSSVSQTFLGAIFLRTAMNFSHLTLLMHSSANCGKVIFFYLIMETLFLLNIVFIIHQ